MRLLTTLLLATLLAALAFSQEGAKPAPADKNAQETAQEWVGEPYTLETCAASGRPIDVKGTPQTVRFAGRELKFCCKGCADFVKKNPDKFLGPAALLQSWRFLADSRGRFWQATWHSSEANTQYGKLIHYRGLAIPGS